MKVAVVGLGAMGRRIACRLAGQGHHVTGWNRGPVPDIEGVTRADTPATAATGADVVITMVSDGAALRAVTAARTGVFAGLADGATLVQMSTVDVETVDWLRTSLPDGRRLLDAPVLGSLAEVDAGTLTLLVGGDPETVADCTPTLAALGAIDHIGAVGAGTAAKLVANSALFGVIGVLAESLVLARGLGLTHEAAFALLDRTPLAVQAQRRRPAIESGTYEPRFTLDMALKDANLVHLAAQSRDLPLLLMEAMRQWLTDASAAGFGALDYTSVLHHVGVTAP